MLDGNYGPNILVGPTTYQAVLSSSIVPAPVQPQVESLFYLWILAQPDYYVSYTYVSGNLSEAQMWADNTMTSLIFTKVFNYTAGTLTSIVITQASTGDVATKTFGYTAGTLTSITVIQ